MRRTEPLSTPQAPCWVVNLLLEPGVDGGRTWQGGWVGAGVRRSADHSVLSRISSFGLFGLALAAGKASRADARGIFALVLGDQPSGRGELVTS